MKLEIELEEKNPKTMYLRTELASGDYNGNPFELCLHADNKSLIFSISNKIYVLNLYDLTKKILEAIE